MNPNDVAPMFAMLMVFGIPIVAILTSHQRKMALIVRENARQAYPGVSETQMLRDEIRELKTLVYQQSIALDNLARPLPNEANLQERVSR